MNDKRKKLEKYYNYIKHTILPHQSSDLGLFSRFDSDNFGHVRENVYCVICLWAASLAFKYVDDASGKAYELEHTAIKCMRSLLQCWMYQTKQVEEFKVNSDEQCCLSTLFDIHTGKPYEGEYNHLQIDAISLYILILCQMTVSGCSIIFTNNEASFVQNMIFTIERAYRTSDYGFWETGSRFSNIRELNSCSIGTAKAALEAANGLNILGPYGDPSCVLFSDPDAHYRNACALNNLLPRESFSKEIDASLLSIIGFPSFSIDSLKLRQATLDIIDNILKGSLGYRRFPLDLMGIPYAKPQNANETINIHSFANQESEWPIFYIYQAIYSRFVNDDQKMHDFDKIIKGLTVKNTEGYKLLPMYYYVTDSPIYKNQIQLRKSYPDSTKVFLMGQSLYITYLFLKSKLIKCSALDPLQRHLLRKDSFQPIMNNKRHSTYRTRKFRTIIQVCLLTHDVHLQKSLAMYGVITQNFNEIEPAFVCDPVDIISIFSMLGKNARLGLTGRPPRPIGLINSCKVFRFLGKIIVTYPLSLDDKNFYLSNDIEMTISHLKTKLVHISKSWNMYGRPTIFLLLKKEHFAENRFVKMMKFIYELKSNCIEGVTIKIDKFKNLLGTACNEYLDFLPKNYNIVVHSCLQTCASSSSSTLSLERIDHRSLSVRGIDSSLKISRQKPIDLSIRVDQNKIEGDFDDKKFLDILENENDFRVKLIVLREFFVRYGPNYSLGYINKAQSTVIDEVTSCLSMARLFDGWSSIRAASGLLEKIIDELTPSISAILVEGKTLVIGCYGHSQFVLTDPLTPRETYLKIREFTLNVDPRDTSLQQEIVIYIANLIQSTSTMFADISKINIGWIIFAMQSILTWGSEQTEAQAPNCDSTYSIYNLSPFNIDKLLSLTISGFESQFLNITVNCLNSHQRRLIDGALCKVPKNFYQMIWKILGKCPLGIQLFDTYIPQLPILHIMTPDEINFSFFIEITFNEAKDPVERQLYVEMITVIASLLDRNPELEFSQCLNIEHLINDARKIYESQVPINSTTNFSTPTRSFQQCSDKFECLPSKLNNGTTFYMIQAAINILISQQQFNEMRESGCVVS